VPGTCLDAWAGSPSRDPRRSHRHGYQRHAKRTHRTSAPTPSSPAGCGMRAHLDPSVASAGCTRAVQSAADTASSKETQGSISAAVFAPIPFTLLKSVRERNGPSRSRDSRIRPASWGPTRGRRIKSSSAAILMPSPLLRQSRWGDCSGIRRKVIGLAAATTSRSPPSGGGRFATARRTSRPRASRPTNAISDGARPA
jgi:hypothetical protein